MFILGIALCLLAGIIFTITWIKCLNNVQDFQCSNDGSKEGTCPIRHAEIWNRTFMRHYALMRWDAGGCLALFAGLLCLAVHFVQKF